MPPKKNLSEFADVVAEIAADDLAELEARLLSGIDVNGTDILGRTLLMKAAEMGKTGCVRLLLGHRAKIDTRDRRSFDDSGGKTALHQAVEHRHYEVARLLVSAGADLDVRDKLGDTALHLAVANNDVAMIELLLNAGADPNGGGRTVTPLSNAALMGFTDAAKLLIDKGADPNHPVDVNGLALASAVYSKKPELCRLLLDAGAQVNAKDRDGKTALDSVGLTTMPERFPGLTLSPEQLAELREKVAAAALIRSMLIEAGASETFPLA